MSTTTVKFVDRAKVGEQAAELLEKWHRLEPDKCKMALPFPTFPEFVVFLVKLRSGGFYEVSSSRPWLPSSVELALISRSVAEAAADRGWISYATPIDYPNPDEPQRYKGKVRSLNVTSHDKVFAWEIGDDEAIAHLAAYLRAIESGF